MFKSEVNQKDEHGSYRNTVLVCDNGSQYPLLRIRIEHEVHTAAYDKESSLIGVLNMKEALELASYIENLVHQHQREAG